jgi:8-oxo-dGTP pyrophosphatase MutT (NUDIX family)
MLRPILRALATMLHRLLALGWFVRRPRTFGAHAVALTPERKLILVKLWYAPHWRLPGGGRGAEEPAADAALRELREEIGMTSHGGVDPAGEFEESTDYKRDLSSLAIIRDVEFQPKRWSWEVERVGLFDLDRLPKGLSPQSRRWLKTVTPRL